MTMKSVGSFGLWRLASGGYRPAIRRGAAAALVLALALPSASLCAESANGNGLRLAGGQITNGGGRASDFTGVVLYGRLAQPAAAQRAVSGDGNVVRGTLRFPLERRATALDWMLYE